MTTPYPTPFSTTAPCAGVFTLFVIISDSNDEITTLPIRPTPSSPDRTPALCGYPLDSGDDSSNEDLSETANQPGNEIPMPLGYRAAMNRWRVTPSSTWYLLLSSELPSSSRKRSKLLSPLLPPSVPPPPDHIESVGDNIEASIWNLERHPSP
ncbi:hypothetical protein Tco_0452921 [Tanacetum coccineum]